MKPTRFTDAMIRALKPKEARYEVWEGRGFGIRVSPSGEKSWVFLYRWRGKARRMTLGRYPGMGLTDAHAAHSQARLSLQKGVDPGAKAVEERKAERDASTVSGLIAEYLEKWARPRKKTWKEDERCLNREVIPFIGDKKAAEVRRRDIIQILDRIVDRAPAMANRTMNVLTRLFNFAVTRDILGQSPCVALSLPAKKSRRERVLTDDEIRAIWSLDAFGMTTPNQLALRLLIATGQRRAEVVRASWSEFDMQRRLWSIPGSHTKNGLNHAVPLNQTAMDTLEDIRELSGESDYLFPSGRTGMHLDPRAVTRAMRKATRKAGLVNANIHDTRKTFATGLASLKVDRFIIKNCMNHKIKDVLAEHYDFFEYLDEKTDAMNRWGRKLEGILSGEDTEGKIITMKRKGEK